MARLARLSALLIVFAALLGCMQSLDLKNSIVESVKAQEPFTLTLTTGTGGTVAQSSVEAYPNKPTAITAIPSAGGYLFDYWSATPAGAAVFADPNSEATTVTVASRDLSVSIQASFMAPANRKWVGIASSADGRHLAAVATGSGAGDQIYTSANFGTTWTLQKSSPTMYWSCITSDSTGRYLAAASTNPGGNIYTSSDYGKSWIMRTAGLPDSSTTPVNWSSISSDGAGLHLVAAVFSGAIYMSSDRGASWTAVPNGSSTPAPGLPKDWKTSLPDENWVSVICDSSGQNIVAAVSGENIYASNDFGLNWYRSYTPSATTNWTCLAGASGSAEFRAALADQSDVYIDYLPGKADNWFPYTVDSSQHWTAITSDATGKFLVATATGDSIYRFNWDQGTANYIWKKLDTSIGLPSTAAWRCIAGDGTGDKLVAGVNDGHIYYSSNQGATWTSSL